MAILPVNCFGSGSCPASTDLSSAPPRRVAFPFSSWGYRGGPPVPSLFQQALAACCLLSLASVSAAQRTAIVALQGVDLITPCTSDTSTWAKTVSRQLNGVKRSRVMRFSAAMVCCMATAACTSTSPWIVIDQAGLRSTDATRPSTAESVPQSRSPEQPGVGNAYPAKEDAQCFGPVGP